MFNTTDGSNVNYIPFVKLSERKDGEGHRTNCHDHQRTHSKDGVTQA